MILILFTGALLYGMISVLVAAMVWMFTTVVGLVVLGVFVVMFLGYLVNPDDEEYVVARYQVKHMPNVKVQGDVRATRYAVEDTRTGKLVGRKRPPYYDNSIDAQRTADRMNEED